MLFFTRFYIMNEYFLDKDGQLRWFKIFLHSAFLHCHSEDYRCVSRPIGVICFLTSNEGGLLLTSPFILSNMARPKRIRILLSRFAFYGEKAYVYVERNFD